MILNAREEKAPHRRPCVLPHLRRDSNPAWEAHPAEKADTTMPSRSGWTPLFLKAIRKSTGMALRLDRRVLMQAISSSSSDILCHPGTSPSTIVKSEAASSRAFRAASASSRVRPECQPDQVGQTEGSRRKQGLSLRSDRSCLGSLLPPADRNLHQQGFGVQPFSHLPHASIHDRLPCGSMLIDECIRGT